MENPPTMTSNNASVNTINPGLAGNQRITYGSKGVEKSRLDWIPSRRLYCDLAWRFRFCQCYLPTEVPNAVCSLNYHGSESDGV